MKKTIALILALGCLTLASPGARAEHLTGKDGWNVTFTTENKLVSNFRTADYNDPVAGLQPGDDITFTVTLQSQNEQTADWYMTNEVLHSLEDRSKSGSKGGAYSYTLTYIGPKQTRVLYDSDTVGGDTVSAAGQGLNEATSALKNYFFLDTLSKGQSAKVTLKVALDGESQGNRYQDTLADLRMNFAVQVRETVVKTPSAKTGDETRLAPLFGLLALSGGGLLSLGALDLRRRKTGRR